MATTTRRRTSTAATRPATRTKAVRPDAGTSPLIRQKTTGFYKDPITGERYRSVTTIINQGVPKEALVYWAGNITAETAIANLPYLVANSRDPQKRTDAYDWLRRAHTRKKDERADVGSIAHALGEANVLGDEVPTTRAGLHEWIRKVLIDQGLVKDVEQLTAEFLDNAVAYVQQWRRFVDDWEVVFEASEMVVANFENDHAGTLDYIIIAPLIVRALISLGVLPADADPELPLMGDTKTGGEICWGDNRCRTVRPSEFRKGCPAPRQPHAIKGVYPEAGLQMSAYRRSTFAWLRDGTRVDMPATHPVGIVLHLQPEGYLLHAARCDDDVYEYFRHAQIVAEWTSLVSKDVLGGVLTPAPASVKGAA